MDDKQKKALDCILRMTSDQNSGISRAQFYSMNLIDATDVSEDDLKSANQEVISYCAENEHYAALPPFEEGGFIIRGDRIYVHWKVLDVQDDYFRLSLDHYEIACSPASIENMTLPELASSVSAMLDTLSWFRVGHVVVKVKLLTKAEHINLLKFHPEIHANVSLVTNTAMLEQLSDQLRTRSHIGGIVEDYEYFLPHMLKKIAKKGKYVTSDGTPINGKWVRDAVSNIESSIDTERNRMLFNSVSIIPEALVYINYMLSQKSTRGTALHHITSSYALAADDTDLRKERHFGKIRVISEKKPRAVSVQNIHRVYTMMSWARRGHLRHLASGKIVPVKSAVCRRKNSGETTTPVVVYKV